MSDDRMDKLRLAFLDPKYQAEMTRASEMSAQLNELLVDWPDLASESDSDTVQGLVQKDMPPL